MNLGEASMPGRHTQATRRGENARHTDADGSVDSTSASSSVLTDLRGGIFRV